jgi:hypothetical protein
MINGKGPCSLPAHNSGCGGPAPFISEQPRVHHDGYHQEHDHQADEGDGGCNGLDHFHEKFTPPASSGKLCCPGCKNEKAKYTAIFWTAIGWEVGDRRWERLLGGKEGNVLPLVTAGGSS